MARGDLISVPCVWGVVPYRHFGIDIGDGSVVHLAAHADSQSMQVHRVRWEDFAGSKPISVEEVESRFSSDEVVQRALQAIGVTGYHLTLGNCEHFARSCKTGEPVSHQADRAVVSALRTSFAGVLACSTRGAICVAATTGLPRSILGRAAGVASLLAEVARQSAYVVSRKCEIDHRRADSIGRAAGTITAAIVGGVAGGPIGGASSAALYLSIDQLSCKAWKKWGAGARPVEEPRPYRKWND